MASARGLIWNGTDLPEEPRALPAGRHVIESADDVPHLTHDEDERLRQALTSMRAGNGRSVEQVRGTIDALLHR